MARGTELGEGKLPMKMACPRNRRTDRSGLDHRREGCKRRHKLSSSESLALQIRHLPPRSLSRAWRDLIHLDTRHINLPFPFRYPSLHPAQRLPRQESRLRNKRLLHLPPPRLPPGHHPNPRLCLPHHLPTQLLNPRTSTSRLHLQPALQPLPSRLPRPQPRWLHNPRRRLTDLSARPRAVV